MARRWGISTAVAAVVALVLAMSAPAALAHHKQKHPRGGGKSAAHRNVPDRDKQKGSAVTEDNDGDGRDNEGAPGAYPTDSDHPSGKDRYEEGGSSGNQGNSGSEPDGDGRGTDRLDRGVDKPGHPGGEDPYDQDGNNGCGNDQDFEDDNNGWCGRNPERNNVKPLPVETRGVEVDEPEVLGIRMSRAPAAPAVEPASVAAASLGAASVAASSATQGGLLPFTGSGDLLPFVVVALILIAAGILGLRARRATN